MNSELNNHNTEEQEDDSVGNKSHIIPNTMHS